MIVEILFNEEILRIRLTYVFNSHRRINIAHRPQAKVNFYLQKWELFYKKVYLLYPFPIKIRKKMKKIEKEGNLFFK